MAVTTALASVALAVAAGIGAGPPIMMVGAVLAMVSFFAIMLSKKNGLPTEYFFGGSAPKQWTWWTGLAALLGGLYVLFAVGQLIDDPKATNVGALGIMSGFAGMIFFGLKLRGRLRIAGHWMVIFATVPALMFFWIVWPAVLGLAIITGAVTEIARASPRTPMTA
ncbi:MAG: hypothetical protein ACRDQ2_13130 [Gaiellales bacterium]